MHTKSLHRPARTCGEASRPFVGNARFEPGSTHWRGTLRFDSSDRRPIRPSGANRCRALRRRSTRERSRTRPYLRTDVKDRLSQLRATLTPDEQSLLVLRVDRGLSWEEVGRVLCDDGEPDDASIRRHAVNLRQRFRQLTERLRERARAEGWFDEDS